MDLTGIGIALLLENPAVALDFEASEMPFGLFKSFAHGVRAGGFKGLRVLVNL